MAEEKKLRFIDLNQASINYVNAIGQQATLPYNYANGTDRTHLSEWGRLKLRYLSCRKLVLIAIIGGVVFSRLVSDLLVEKYPKEFVEVTVKNATLSALIKEGKAA